MPLTRLGAVLLVAAVLAGTILDATQEGASAGGNGLVLAADFHVHPFPGDGALTIRQLRREARRRGLDVIALTAHNNLAAWRLGQVIGAGSSDVIVLPGQEVTAPGFHLIAAGITNLIDWRLPVGDAIAAIQAQGGAAIAAHPVDASWIPRDPEALAGLDGAEVAHPEREHGREGEQLDRFFAAARAANPALSAVGSSDFHTTAPLGRCRTYLFVDERSPAGVVRALRSGRTVAEDANGRLIGPPELVARVPADRRGRGERAVSTAEQACAMAALLGVGLLCMRRDPAIKSRDTFITHFRNTP